MKKIFLLFSVCILSFSTFSQPDITVLKKENSFTGEWIKDIFKDSEGTLWFGDDSGYGLMKYDGEKWTSYSDSLGLPLYIQTIAEDTAGKILIGAFDGLYVFDKISSVVKYTTSSGLPSNNIKDIFVDETGIIWIATYSGLCRYNGSSWVTYTTTDGLISNFVTSIYKDTQGRLWIGTLEGLTKLQGTFISYTTTGGLPSNTIRSITQATDGKLWFATNNGAVSFNEISFSTFKTTDGLASNDLSSVFGDSDGNIWFTSYTPNGGIVKYNGSEWAQYKISHGLVNNSTDCIEEDDDGNIWIGTGTGVSSFNPESWKYITVTDGLLENNVLDIYEDNSNNKWIATYSGLNIFSKTIKEYTTEEGFPDNRCYKIQPDNSGNIWVGTLGGAVKMTGDTFLIYNTDSGLIKNYVYDITIDGNNIWFITTFGVSKLNNGVWTNYTTNEGLVSNNNFCSLLDKSGKLWIGSLEKGVSCYDGILWKHYDKLDGLSSNVIWEMFQDNEENIWFATDSGLTRFNGSTFNIFSKTDGLPSNKITSITQDGYGNLWFGADSNKIAVYNGTSFTTHTISTAIPDGVTMVIKEINDTIFAGGTYGLAAYSYKTAWESYVKSRMPGDTIHNIIADKDDNLWIGTYGNGIGKFDGCNWSVINESDGIAGKNIYSIAEDTEGNIWAASETGVSKISTDTIVAYDGSDGLSGTIWSAVAADKDNNIWIGSNQGLSKFNGGNFTNYTTSDGLPGNYVTCILVTKNNDLWIGTSSGNGAGKFNGTNWQTFGTAEGLINKNINNIIEDSDGNIWFATYGGISKFNGASFTNYSSEAYFGNAVIWSVYEDKMGIIWAGSWGNGIFSFNGKTWQKLQNTIGNDIRSIAMQNDGKLWFASYGNGLTSLYRDVIKMDSVIYTNLKCNGDNEGSIRFYSPQYTDINFSIDSENFTSQDYYENLSPGIYLPAVTNKFDTIFYDTVKITEPAVLEVNLGKDTTICEGENITLSAPFSWNYEWNTGDKGIRQLITDTAGIYSVVVSDKAGCLYFDTIAVSISELPMVNIGENFEMAELETKTLNAGEGFSKYQWSTGDVTPTLLVTGPAKNDSLIWVIVTNEYGCINTDSVTYSTYIEVGISDINSSFITIYPVPANDKIFIKGLENLQIEVIELLNESGQTINTFEAGSVLEINLSGLNKGRYFVVIRTSNQRLVKTFIIQ